MKKLLFVLLILMCFGSIRSQIFSDSLSISPNPFIKRTSAFYSFAQNDTVSFFICNVIGQNILSIHTNSIMNSGAYQDSVIMDSFPDGVYFAVLKIGNRNTITKKIIKSVSAGIEEKTFVKNVMIYPNPASGMLYLSLKSSEALKINILDYTGKIILNSPYTETFDTSTLKNGVYIVEIVSTNGIKFRSKLIKE